MAKKVRKSRKVHKRRAMKRVPKATYALMYHPPGKKYSNSCLPPCYRTKFTAIGNFISGSGGGSSPCQLTVKFNSPNIPFGAAGALGGLTLYGVLPGTYQPAGLSQLFNNNTYTSFRILGVKISIQPITESPQDNVYATITASSTIGTPANVAVAETQPFTVNAQFGQSRGNKPLTMFLKPHEFFGVRPEAIKNDMSQRFYGTTALAPLNPIYLVINLVDTVNSTFINPIGMTVKVVYYTELFGLANATLVET